jgi:RES domain-containing protein
VILTAWRIVKHCHAAAAFNGDGARRFGGRWNRPGTPVVYLAESQALAALEMLVHLDEAPVMLGYATIRVEFDAALVEAVSPEVLPANWRSEAGLEALRTIGEEWYGARRSAVLKAPSVIIPTEYNYVLNPAHPDFGAVMIAPPAPFSFDRRLRTRV